MLFALKPLNLTGTPEGRREVGQAVPEAYAWPNLYVYLENGYVEERAEADKAGIIVSPAAQQALPHSPAPVASSRYQPVAKKGRV